MQQITFSNPKIPTYDEHLNPDYRIVFRADAYPNPGKGTGYIVLQSLRAGTSKRYMAIPLGDHLTNNQAACKTLQMAIDKLTSVLTARNLDPAKFNLEIQCNYTVVTTPLANGYFNESILSQFPKIQDNLAGYAAYKATYRPKAEILEIINTHE